MQSILALSFLLPLLVNTSPVNTQKVCTEHTLSVDVTTNNLKWNFPELKTEDDIAALNTYMGRRDAKSLPPLLLPSEEPLTNATYTISGTLCKPAKGASDTLLVATHGGGYNRASVSPSQIMDHADQIRQVLASRDQA
jgi:hypothetical protein